MWLQLSVRSSTCPYLCPVCQNAWQWKTNYFWNCMELYCYGKVYLWYYNDIKLKSCIMANIQTKKKKSLANKEIFQHVHTPVTFFLGVRLIFGTAEKPEPWHLIHNIIKSFKPQRKSFANDEMCLRVHASVTVLPRLIFTEATAKHITLLIAEVSSLIFNLLQIFEPKKEKNCANN